MRLVFSWLVAGVLILFSVAGITGCKPPAQPVPLPFPTEKPEFTVPGEFKLPGPFTTWQGQKVNLDSNINNHRFRDCEVWVASDNIVISDSFFENSVAFISDKSNVVFDAVIFQGLNQYEKATLSVNNSSGIVVRDCQFVNNYIGLGVHGSSAEVLSNRFEGNNGHNALVIGEGSSVKVRGNYFYGSFPHAILIMNREGSTEARVEITGNLIEQTGEDAIDFEDYRNAASGTVAHNTILNSGWSAVIVEYNSWEASIDIENNWIEGTGIDWKLPTHTLQPDRFQFGWGHGILIEDSSEVRVLNNRILAASENGIEVMNSRDVVLRGNGISCSQVGIGVHQYEEESLYRNYSPLAQENAGGSEVKADNNTFYEAKKDYDVDEYSQLAVQ